jgi:hypothetical protein
VRPLPHFQGWQFESWTDAQSNADNTRKYVRMALAGRRPQGERVELWLLVRAQVAPLTSTPPASNGAGANAREPAGAWSDRIADCLISMALEVGLCTVLTRRGAWARVAGHAISLREKASSLEVFARSKISSADADLPSVTRHSSRAVP